MDSRKMHNVVSVVAQKKSKKSWFTRWKKGIKAAWRRDKLRRAVDTCCRTFAAAGRAGGGSQRARLPRAAPQRYGRAKFDKVESHLPESAAVSPRRTEMNFSSASFDFSPKIKSTELWHKMKSVWDLSFFPAFTSFLSFFPSFVCFCCSILPSFSPCLSFLTTFCPSIFSSFLLS